jgi:type III secretion system (T3SS) inner membrane Yop/YscD-like protein
MALKGRYRLIIKQGPVPGKVFEIAKQVITLGRDVKSDFVVNDAEVSRSHTRLTVQSDGCLAEDLGSTNGTYINGQRITGAKMIRPGDVLGLGETVLIDFVFVPDAEATLIAPPLDIPPEPVTPAMPFPARPALGPRVVLPTAQSSDALQAPFQPQRDSRMLWAAGAGCGVLLLIACLALVVAVIVIALNPNILHSLGGR